jgi:putative spermidine/putrescine transport system permease protein
MSLPYSSGYRRASLAFLVIYMICIFLPLLTIIVWSCTDYWPWPRLLPSNFSLRGLNEIFNTYNPLAKTLITSVLIGAAVSLLSVVIATMAARALVHHSFMGKEFFRFTTILPFLVPATVFAMGVQVLFLRVGLADTLPGVIIAHTIIALPYALTIMTDVTAAAGYRLEEQASALGANRRQTLCHIMLPALIPGLLSAASMSYIISFSQYFVTLLIGGGTVNTLAVTMFPFLTGDDRTIGSAYAVVFMGITFTVFLCFEVLLKRFGVRKQGSFFE